MPVAASKAGIDLRKNFIEQRSVVGDNGGWIYILLGAAKDIKYGTKYLTLGDLSDRSLVSPKIYKLISQAMQIKRCGLAALQETNGGRV